jgi:hypothetical protein
MPRERTAGLGIADIIGNKRESVLKLAAQHGATDVRVFGSVARGEARPDSDVDLIVKFPPDASIFDQVGLWQDLTDLIGREVDLIADHPSGGAVMRAALKEAVSL